MRLPGLLQAGPFLDESDFTLIGMRFFRDPGSVWLWPTIGGSVAVYPPLSYLAYLIGGLAGTRMLSLICGLATVLVVYQVGLLLARRWFSAETPPVHRWMAFAAAALVAVAAGPVYISRQATYDALACLLLALGYWGIAATIRSPRQWFWWAGPAAVGLAIATRYSASMALPALAAFASAGAIEAYQSQSPAPEGRARGWIAARPLAALAVFLWMAAAFPGGVGLIRQRVAANVAMAAAVGRVDPAGVLARAYYFAGPLLLLGAIAFAALISIARQRNGDERRRLPLEALSLGLGSLAPIAIHAYFGHGMGLQKDVAMTALILSPVAGAGGVQAVLCFWRGAGTPARRLLAVATAGFAVYFVIHGAARARQVEASWVDVRPAVRLIEYEVSNGLTPGSLLIADSWSNPPALALAFEPRGYPVDIRAAWRPDALEQMARVRRGAVILARLPLPTRTWRKTAQQQHEYLARGGYLLRARWRDPALPAGRELSLYVARGNRGARLSRPATGEQRASTK